MPILDKQIQHHAHQYVRQGGKRNRRQQVNRIIKFVHWIETQESITGLEQLGKRQVVLFWKNNRELSDATLYGYWLAISLLWKWIGKPNQPPEPFTNLNKNVE